MRALCSQTEVSGGVVFTDRGEWRRGVHTHRWVAAWCSHVVAWRRFQPPSLVGPRAVFIHLTSRCTHTHQHHRYRECTTTPFTSMVYYWDEGWHGNYHDHHHHWDEWKHDNYHHHHHHHTGMNEGMATTITTSITTLGWMISWQLPPSPSLSPTHYPQLSSFYNAISVQLKS